MAYLDNAGLDHLWTRILGKIGTKADKTEVAFKTDLNFDQISGVVPVAKGGTGATAKGTTLLSNIGVASGTADAPATGTPGTIYIQYI